MEHGTILSLSFDQKKLKLRETILRAAGFEVFSVDSPARARFEIEKGQCGIFVTCRLVPDIVNRDLMQVFRRYCRDGWIIFVAGDEDGSSPYQPKADIRVPEAKDPEGIVAAIRARHG